MDRFYAAAAAALVDNNAIVDKFVGDEVIGIFIPALTHGNHASDAIYAARDLMRATGNDTDAPWAPTGIGINTGQAFVGVVGTAEHIEFTALGNAVNLTSRLASARRCRGDPGDRGIGEVRRASRAQMCGDAGGSTSEVIRRRPMWWCSRWRDAPERVRVAKPPGSRHSARLGTERPTPIRGSTRR